MKKNNKYGRNPKLNPKTHCVMVRFDDVEWNKFLTMYEESTRVRESCLSEGALLRAEVQGVESRQGDGGLLQPNCPISTPSSVPSARTTIKP